MALNRTFTYQQLEEIKIKTYVKGLFDIFGHRAWTKEEWDEVVDKDVKVFLDEKQTRAQAAAKARKTASKKKGKKGQSKTAREKGLKKLLGPQPKGANTKCDTVLGPGMGKKKKDGSAYFIFPPLDAESRANWPHKDRIKTKNSSFGKYLEEVLIGFWASPDPEHASYPMMTDEQLVYYKLKEAPTQGSPMTGGGAAAKAAPVDELASLSWLGGAKAVEQEPKVEDPAETIKAAAQVAAAAVLHAFHSTEDAGNAAAAALEKRDAARKRIWEILQNIKTRSLVYPESRRWIFVSPMDMDALNACVFASKHMFDAIMWKCSQPKYQRQAKMSEEQMRAHWFSTWGTMNMAARRGDVDALQDQLTSANASELGICKGMTQDDVLIKVFSIAFSKPLRRTKDHVTISDTEIGEDGVHEFMLDYARHCHQNGKNGGAKWVTDILAADADDDEDWSTADDDSDDTDDDF